MTVPRPPILAAIATATFVAAAPALAQRSAYVGEETRSIKALDPATIEGLRAGDGLGYAKAAELNLWPGPAHALELADELELTAAQREAIEAIRATMREEARSLGAELIAAEARLDGLFATGSPSPRAIDAASAEAAAIEGRLRAAHLRAHLATSPLLNETQRARYAELRGYGGAHRAHGAGHGGHGG